MIQNSKKIAVKSFAKINLFLRVCGKREDGFHQLATLYQTIDLADRLFFEIVKEADSGFECAGEEAPPFSENLIRQAQHLLQAEFPGRIAPLRIRLEKQIPIGAGLGGGSSNAAATLVALNLLCKLGLSSADLEVRAARLGSDVPLFIRGGAQLGRGRGEQLERVGDPRPIALVLIKPSFTISTREAYGWFEDRRLAMELSRREAAARLLALRKRRWAQVLENSFEPLAEERYPELRRIKRDLLGNGCEAALLCGSGSAVFGIAPDKAAAARIRRECEGRYAWVRETSSVPGGWRSA